MRALDWWRNNDALDNIYLRRVAGGPLNDGEEILEALQRVVGERRLLDFGCGFGRLARLFSPSQYVGVDVNPFAIKKARELQPGYQFEEWTGHGQLPAADMALLYAVLIHIPDEDLEFVLGNVVRSAGQVVIADRVNTRDEKPTHFPPTIVRKAADIERIFVGLGCLPVSQGFFDHPGYPRDRLPFGIMVYQCPPLSS